MHDDHVTVAVTVTPAQSTARSLNACAVSRRCCFTRQNFKLQFLLRNLLWTLPEFSRPAMSGLSGSIRPDQPQQAQAQQALDVLKNMGAPSPCLFRFHAAS
jgi:hypothetical protein